MRLFIILSMLFTFGLSAQDIKPTKKKPVPPEAVQVPAKPGKVTLLPPPVRPMMKHQKVKK